MRRRGPAHQASPAELEVRPGSRRDRRAASGQAAALCRRPWSAKIHRLTQDRIAGTRDLVRDPWPRRTLAPGRGALPAGRHARVSRCLGAVRRGVLPARPPNAPRGEPARGGLSCAFLPELPGPDRGRPLDLGPRTAPYAVAAQRGSAWPSWRACWVRRDHALGRSVPRRRPGGQLPGLDHGRPGRGAAVADRARPSTASALGGDEGRRRRGRP